MKGASEWNRVLWCTSLSHGRDFIVTMAQLLQLAGIQEENKADVSLAELRLEVTQVEI